MFDNHRVTHWMRRVTLGGLVSTLAFVGVAGLSAPAFAHTNLISGVATCASPLGTGYQVDWTVANDWNLLEQAKVTSVTGGIPTITPHRFSIFASGDGSGGGSVTPYSFTKLVQILPPTASSTITLVVGSTFTDGFQTSNSGLVSLPPDCQAPTNIVSPAPSAALPDVSIVTPTPSTLAVPPQPTLSSSLSILKTERVDSQRPFVRGPIVAALGEKIDYRIVVTNIGDTQLNILMTDSRCDVNTLEPSGPMQSLVSGGSLAFTCSHLLSTVPDGNTYRNMASVVGVSPQGTTVGPFQSAVTARVFAPILKVRTLVVARPAQPVLKVATFTG